ncbi:MAG: hypothetical protein LBF65_01295 [Holosporales bacterium]|jgi:hypothetical protein|nr:hypothetical protein [Holosporales bacterium]
MNVRCPYCGCCYEISSDLLKNPIGDEKLGYGWWLRCFKCNKKWWLKNSDIVLQSERSLKADKNAKVENLSRLLPKQRKRRKSRFFVRYLSVILIVLLGTLAFYKWDLFRDYLLDRIKHLSQITSNKLTMLDVKYTTSNIENNGIKIFVTGMIKNEDNVVAKVKGIKVTIFDGDREVKSWTSSLQAEFVVPHDSMSFSTANTLDRAIENMKVEVSIF